MTTNTENIIGTRVRFDGPQGWGDGEVVATAPHRIVTGHDGTGVTWGESSTHFEVTIEWVDGHESFGTEPGTQSVHVIGHSFATFDTHGGWPKHWNVTGPGVEVNAAVQS
jgi:hypothetical protein